MSGKKWTKEELEILKDNAGKMSIYDLMNLLPNRTKLAIKVMAVNLNLSLRFLQSEKHHIDYSFFEKLTPELCHFIGFWYADGNISKDLKRLNITLSIKDKIFLEDLVKQFTNSKLRMCLCRPNEIIFSIHNIKLCKILNEKYKFIPQKSLILEFPDYINDDLIKYFIQGFFEGDGWVTSKYQNVGFTSGSNIFLIKLQNKLHSMGFEFNLTKDKLETNTKTSYRFLQWIYENNNIIKMNRKYQLYKERRRYNKFNENNITIWSLAKIVGVHNQTLYNWLKKEPITNYYEDLNGYKRYNIDNIRNWLCSLGKYDLAEKLV